jgi:DNA (cytosine-5)-methyltransferase 1
MGRMGSRRRKAESGKQKAEMGRGMVNELALFAGAGGGILGGKLLGWRTVCAVERDAFAAAVLAQRQNDGCFEAFPIWSDVETFDGRPWRGIVDVVSGGFPCTDISCAGKGAGIDGEESGLWREFARIIGEVGPRYVLVENSPMLTVRGLGRVLGDLAALGFDAEWGVLSAADAIWFECLSRGDRPALDHLRERIWIVAENAESDEHGRGERRGATGGTEACERAQCEACGPVVRESADVAFGRLAMRWWTPGGAGYADSVCAVADSATWENDRRNGGSLAEAARRREGCDTPVDAGGEAVADDDKKHGDTGGSGAGEVFRIEREAAELSGLQARTDGVRERLEREREGGTTAGTVDGPGDGDYSGWWAVEPGVGRLVHGLSDRVDRCKALGNGQVPAVVRLAWRMLNGRAG